MLSMMPGDKELLKPKLCWGWKYLLISFLVTGGKVIKGEQCRLSTLSQPQMFPIFSSSGLLVKLALVHSANQLPTHPKLFSVCPNMKRRHWFLFIMSCGLLTEAELYMFAFHRVGS